MDKTKPFQISKQAVWQAFKRVKANGGSAGIDGQTIEEFERDLEDNLYKLWNRMSSGSYFPSNVKRVGIPKGGGEIRYLGIPTVADRVAQMVVKILLEPELDKHFHEDSYGYRPGKSALEAVGVARKRCWQYDWVLDVDIQGFFDNLDHALLMRGVGKHTDCKWIVLYIERWLNASVQTQEGVILTSKKGTPQGGVISPLLANLFLHYAFDLWMRREEPQVLFERYADDILCHCRTEEQARHLQERIRQRFKVCGLTLHPEKTRIIYCRDWNRKRSKRYTAEKFNFLGYTFQPRKAQSSTGHFFVGFLPGVSQKAAKNLRQKVRRLRIHLCTTQSLGDIAQWINPMIRGWMNYFRHYYRTALYPICRHIDRILVRWATKKYKKFRRRARKAEIWLGGIAKRQPTLFYYWRIARPTAGQ